MPNQTVLIAESLGPVRARLAKIFADQGFEILEAVTPAEVMRALGSTIPSAFVLSSSLGAGQGLALARGLGALSATKGRPVLLLLDDAKAAADLARNPLHEAVIPIVKCESVDALIKSIALKLGSRAPAAGGEAPPRAPGGREEPSGPAGDAHASPPPTSEAVALEKSYSVFERIVDMVNKDELPGPMIPGVLTKVISLFNNPNVSFKDISLFIRGQQALSARLLMVANSAFYLRSGMKVTSVDAALSRLGLRETAAVLQAAAARAYVVGKDPALQKIIMRQLEVAQLVAFISQELAAFRKAEKAGDAYSVGLFHNVGCTFLFYTVGLLQDKGMIGKVEYPPLEAMVAERAGELNRLMCERMKLPIGIVAVHAVPPAAGDPVVDAVLQGIWAATKLYPSMEPERLELGPEAEALGVTPESINQVASLLPKLVTLLDTFRK